MPKGEEVGGIGEEPGRMGIIFNRDPRSPRPSVSPSIMRIIFRAEENQNVPPFFQDGIAEVGKSSRHLRALTRTVFHGYRRHEAEFSKG